MRNELDLEIALGQSRLRRIAIEVAEVKAELAARRFLYEIKKYNPTQPRAPRGSPIGGQWVDAGGANSSRQSRSPPVAAKPKVKIPRSIQQNAPIGATEAAPAAARAVGLPLAAAVVGVSRAAGTFEHFTTGRSVTPILKIPFGSSLSPSSSSPFGVAQRGTQEEHELDKECAEQYDRDIETCHMNSAMYGRSERQKKKIFSVCAGDAMVRRTQCKSRGGVDKITKELFDGRRS